MNRILVRTAIGAGLAGLVFALASTAHADGGAGGGGDHATTMRLVATTATLRANAGDKSPAGDVYAYQDTLRTRDGKKVGEDHCFCVALNADDMVCTGVLQVTGGSLTFTQPYSNATGRGTGSITGGTGRYEGAQGTFTAVGRKGSDPAVYDYTLRFTTP